MADQVIIRKEWLDAIKDCSDNVRLQVLEAIFAYGFETEEPEMSTEARMAFRFIKPNIDRMNAKYDAIREKRRLAGAVGANKRWQTIANDSKCHDLPSDANKAMANDSNGCLINKTINKSKNKDVITDADASMSHFAPAKSDAAKADGIDVGKFITFFNTTMDTAAAQIPRLKAMQGTRLGLLKARLGQYGKQALYDAVKKASESDFLNGRAGYNGKVYGIDWILLPNNFPKVLEGNYDNRKQQYNGTSNPPDPDKAKRRGTDIANIRPEDYDTSF